MIEGSAEIGENYSVIHETNKTGRQDPIERSGNTCRDEVGDFEIGENYPENEENNSVGSRSSYIEGIYQKGFENNNEENASHSPIEESDDDSSITSASELFERGDGNDYESSLDDRGCNISSNDSDDGYTQGQAQK